MNPHYDEARHLLDASADLNRGLTDRQTLATRAQAEATLAVVYELQQGRQPAPTTEPSHTGAAPLTSGEFEVGDWVRVVGPDDDPLIGQVGRVRLREQGTSLIDFPDLQAARFNHAYLEPAPNPER